MVPQRRPCLRQADSRRTSQLTERAVQRRARRAYKDYSAPKAALDAWFNEVKKARWSNATDVKRSYATASIVSADRIVFNIKGNDYRLVVAVDFEKSIAWIKWIGTHHALASTPADMLSGTRNSSRRTSPGCMGLSFLIIVASSLINPGYGVMRQSLKSLLFSQ
jgi:mRNA interferase HigB